MGSEMCIRDRYRTKEVLQEDKDNSEGNNQAEISSDWLNSYEDIAENMSSDEMQTRFAKILAGEIKRPSSFSIKSVKLLAEIDTQTASLFARFCSCCIMQKIPSTSVSHVFDARVSGLSGSIGSNSLQKYGLSYDQITSAPTLFNFRINRFQFQSSIIDLHLPINTALFSVRGC